MRRASVITPNPTGNRVGIGDAQVNDQAFTINSSPHVFMNNPLSAKFDPTQVDLWIYQLSIEQKIRFVLGMGFTLPETVDLGQIADAGISGILDGNPDPVAGVDPNPVPGAAGSTYSVPELGIKPMILSDGPAGLRIEPTRKGTQATFHATAFPIATALASSWNPELIESVGRAIGNETREYGNDIILMPALNLHRNPLCGRNFEYFSEDPLLAGKMAAAMVRGVQAEGVGTSIKHFAANNQETNRTSVDSVLSERVLRELYLTGFEIAVKESQPWTVMSSYNKLNGTYTSESRELLTDILRGEWGYEGLVMSDWFAGADIAAQVKAGNDLLMPGTLKQVHALRAKVASGEVCEADLDTNIRRILSILTLSPSHHGYEFSNEPNLRAHAETSRKAATEAMVLLKNEASALPVKQGQTLALFGNASYELIKGGTGSGDVNNAYSIPLEAGLEMAGFTIDIHLEDTYARYIEEQKSRQPKSNNPLFLTPPIPEKPIGAAVAKTAACKNDVAIITLGRNSGEFADRTLEGDFLLTETELDLLRKVSTAFRENNKPVIVVLNIGGVIETASWKDLADAILVAWQPGQEGGNAIADVLSGAVNPSGKLPMTFPINYADAPASQNFPGTPAENPTEVVYEEGLYVGYRYFNSFEKPVSFSFGHGLSYTCFEIGTARLSNPFFLDSIQISVPVKNTGDTAGKQVIQLFLGAPEEALEKPKMELKAFAKTVLLEAGEKTKLTLSLDARSLASYDPEQAAWVAEKGTYSVSIGTSATDIHCTASFELPESVVVQQLQNRLLPHRPIRELTRKSSS